MKSSLKFVPVGALIALAACSGTGCDPTRAGFLEGINCQSGGYQRREMFLDQGLAEAQANALEERADAANAASTAAAMQQTLTARRAKMKMLDGRLVDLRRQLNAWAKREDVDKDAVKRIAIQIEAVSGQQDAVRNNPKPPDLTAIQDRQQQIVKMLQDLN